YFVRATRTGAGGAGAADTADAPFSSSSGVQFFYVNDGSFAGGDWTTAAGNDANDGLSPATPKRSIQSLLSDYDLGPGDVIRIDSGNYVLTSNVIITHDDSGVTIQGFSIEGDAT